MKKIYGLMLILMLLIVCLICGCSSNAETQNEILLNETNLVYAEEISPNEEYIENKNDKIVYIVEIYQIESNDIIVCVNSNSAFFDDIQYQIEYDNKISKSDVNIVWTTIMGNTEDAEDDQYSFVNISISSNGEIFSERKINLIKGAMEIVIDVLEENN